MLNDATTSALGGTINIGPTALPDAFLDTIPEDQSVAQQRVTNLSAASAVASSDSEDDNDEENPQRQRNNIIKAKRIRPPGSTASSNNAIIESGIDESTEQAKLSGAGRGGMRHRHRQHPTVQCGKRSLTFYMLLSLLVVGISVGVYFIVTRAGRNESDDDLLKDEANANSKSSGMPTPELTFPPNFYIDLDTDPPTAAPSMNLDDIAEMDQVLLELSNPQDYYNTTSPQGTCRFWMTRTDQMQLRVSVDGDEAVRQRYTLCVLYHTTGGPTEWLEMARPFLDENLHECDWEGVSCDMMGRVAVLYLAESNLEGRIPSELIHLSNLQLLSLGENKLTGSIPHGLLKLPSLILVDLSSNSLTGEIPATASTSSPTTLNRYSPLEVLYLDDNLLEGTVPFFDTLERMRVQRNLFTGFDPRYATLETLTSWKMYDNALSGTLPQFWNAPDLSYVDLALNQWIGSIPESLWNLPSLESLVLHDAALTGTLPESTVSNHWKYLWVHSNLLDGTIPATLGVDWANVTELLLHNNSLTGSISMDHCDQWPDLKRLETDCNRAEVICDCCTVCHG